MGCTHVLPNLSPYLNISYCFIKTTLKKYMIFYINYEIRGLYSSR